MKFEAARVPSKFVGLFTWAEIWGIGDDRLRSAKVESASSAERAALIHCVSDAAYDELCEWLAGPESFARNPSIEYVALTNLTLAIEYAKALESRNGHTAG